MDRIGSTSADRRGMIRQAVLSDDRDLQTVIALTDRYASEPMGQGRPLDPDVLSRLKRDLPHIPQALIMLAFEGDQAIGLANCFFAYSTFLAKPLLNVHDVYVDPQWRGRGLASRLLQALEVEARQRGCGKITLEVLAGNAAARAAYARAGFRHAAIDSDPGGTLFYTKTLTAT